MSSASDYSVENAPSGASYVAPLVGFQFGQQLASLIPDYFKSTQNARTLAMQQPILGSDGQPTTDIKTIVGELNRRGGVEFAASMLPFLQKQGVLEQPNSPANPPQLPASQQPLNTGPGSGASNAAGPANLRTPQQSAGPPQMATSPSAPPALGMDKRPKKNVS